MERVRLLVNKSKLINRIEYSFLYYLPITIIFFSPSKYILKTFSLPDLFIYFHVVLFLVYIYMKKKIVLNINTVLLCILIIFSIFSLLINDFHDVFSKIKYQIRWLNYLFAFILTANYINQKSYQYLIRGLYKATWIVCVYGIIQTVFISFMLPTIFWIDSFPHYIKTTFRTISTFSNPLNLCTFLVFPLGLLQFQKNKKKRDNVLRVLIYLTLILTASKLAILIILISIIVHFRKYIKQIIYTSFFLSIILIIISSSEVLTNKLKSSFWIFERLNNTRLLEGSINQRKYILSSSIEMVKDNPFFGIGYDNFKEVYLKGGYKHVEASFSSSSFTAENFLIDFYLDNGLVPFLIIVLMFLQCFYIGYKFKNTFLKQLSFSIFLFFVSGFVLSTRSVALLFMIFVFFSATFKLYSFHKHDYKKNEA